MLLGLLCSIHDMGGDAGSTISVTCWFLQRVGYSQEAWHNLSMHISEPIKDPYANCEDGGCSHDLCDGVRIEDLLDHDGPLKPGRGNTPRPRSSSKVPRQLRHVSLPTRT